MGAATIPQLLLPITYIGQSLKQTTSITPPIGENSTSGGGTTPHLLPTIALSRQAALLPPSV